MCVLPSPANELRDPPAKPRWAPHTCPVILLPTDSVRAARGIYGADGAPTPDGLEALAALEKITADRVTAYRREQMRKAWRATRGGGVLFAIPSMLFILVAGEEPGVYWTFFVLFFLGVGALIFGEWRRTRERIRLNAAAAQNYQFRTIETWKRISAMPDAEYARLLRRSQTLDTAGRAAL